ncbi:hypothetical protein NKH75_07245 [Mesorhizobium sp. M0984]|uniref:hypothetical protein n=1 Tax=Mesorhizobium sp. M0984 TaxID=2957041 RepID=UPI00333C8CAD
MTGKLAVSARQVTAICKGAAKAGFIAEMIIGGVTVRLVPGGAPSHAGTAPEEFDTLAEYLAWRDQNQAMVEDDIRL